MKKTILFYLPYFLAGVVACLVIVSLINATSVRATTEVCFCHNVQNNPHTICTSNEGQINGHSGHVNNGQDTAGACIPSPSPTTVPSPTPVDECDQDVCPTSSPSPTPVVTTSPTPRVEETPGPVVTPAPAAPPEWSDPCFYLEGNPECKKKSEIFPGEGKVLGAQK